MSIKFTPYFAITLACCGLLVGAPSIAATPGTEVQVVTTTISPAPAPVAAPAPTKQGQGEAGISLALAKAELSKLGISHPTRAQLNAAQYGGTVTTANGSRVRLAGVQTQRQSGMGWGEIAHAMGLKLGAVVSAAKSAGQHHGKTHESHGMKKVAASTQATHTGAGEGSHAGAGHSGGKK